MFCRIQIWTDQRGDQSGVPRSKKQGTIFGQSIGMKSASNDVFPMITPISSLGSDNKLKIPTGHVCLCHLSNVADIDAMAKIVIQNGGKALLVTNKPSAPCDLPIYRITEETMNRLAGLSNAKVSFELGGFRMERELNPIEKEIDHVVSWFTGGASGDSGTFEQATTFLDKCAKSRDARVIVISQVLRFLQDSSFGNLVHFTIAARICVAKVEIWYCEAVRLIRRLTAIVLERLKQLEPSTCNLEPLSISPNVGTESGLIWDEFFISVMENHASRVPHLVLQKIFWIWNACGLLDMPYSRSKWRAIRDKVHPEFMVRCQGEMQTLIGIRCAQTLCLLLQPNVTSLCEMIDRLEKMEKKQPLNLEPMAAELLLDLATDSVGTEVPLSKIWSMLMEIVRKVSFGSQGIDSCIYRLNIIKAMIHIVSFEAHSSYSFFVELFESISADHPEYHVVLGLLQQNVLDDLQGSRLRTKDVVELMSSSAEVLLSLNNCTATLKEFTIRKMRPKNSFETKLCFLGSLFEYLVIRQRCDDTIEFERFIIECARIAKHADDDSETILSLSFKIADKHPSIFFKSDETTMMEEIATICVPPEACSDILNDPALLRTFRLAKGDATTNSFRHHLTRRLKDTLANECKDVFEASRFCRDAVTADALNCDHTLSVAVHVLASKYWKFSPSSLIDLVSRKHEQLTQLVNCLDLMNSHAAITHGERCIMTNCTNHLRGIVHDWLKRYHRDLLTSDELHQAIRQSHSDTWDFMSELAFKRLPRKDAIDAKSKEFDELRELMSNLLYGDSALSIHRIFKGYGCVIEDTTTIDRLLMDYTWFDTDTTPLDPAPSSSAVVSHGGTLRQMRQDSKDCLAFQTNSDETLQMCEYFLKVPSVLFLSATTGVPVTFESLLNAATRVKDTILNLFSPSSDFKSVSDAVRTILAGGSTIDQEIKALLGCKQLNIDQYDTECFRTVALLSNVCDPLKSFMDCCRQFKLEIVNRDAMFGELVSVIFDVVDASASAASRETCLALIEQLRGLLFSEDLPDDESPEETRKRFQRRLPLFELFGRLLQNSEIWIFAHEMGWFGDSGLRRFMRMISAVGGLSSEVRMRSLFRKIERNKDICHFMESDRDGDIGQLQTNISQIRDWFSNRVDAIASIHRMFDMICRTGEYHIRCHQPGTTQNPDSECVPILTLYYTSKQGLCSHDCNLEGDTLDEFVERLELIEHEEDTASIARTKFVEQYQTLSRATRNFVYLHSLGFDKASALSFDCRVGGESTHERTILASSIMALSNRDAWMEPIRSQYPVCLLFWVIELRELHHMLLQSARGSIEMNLNRLACTVSRLFPSRERTLAYNDRMSIIREAFTLLMEEILEDSESWLVPVSKFLDALYGLFGTNWRLGIPEMGLSTPSNLVVHTLARSEDFMVKGIIRVLEHIYEADLPREFEVLDGNIPCTEQMMSVFLKRVQAFPMCKFVVFNVEAFDGTILEKLSSFLGDCENESNGIQLHCIQREGSMFHKSPWVSSRTWDMDRAPGDLDISPWRALIVDQIHISEVRVFRSDGSTLTVRDELTKLRANSPKIVVGTVLVHEGSTITLLTKALATKFRNAPGPRAVHFSFSYMPELSHDTKEWLQSIHQFFFSFLVLRCVHSPVNLQSFHLEQGEWKIFVELPNTGSQDGATDTASHWLHRYVPTLALGSTIEKPSADMNIDEMNLS